MEIESHYSDFLALSKATNHLHGLGTLQIISWMLQQQQQQYK